MGLVHHQRWVEEKDMLSDWELGLIVLLPFYREKVNDMHWIGPILQYLSMLLDDLGKGQKWNGLFREGTIYILAFDIAPYPAYHWHLYFWN